MCEKKLILLAQIFEIVKLGIFPRAKQTTRTIVALTLLADETPILEKYFRWKKQFRIGIAKYCSKFSFLRYLAFLLMMSSSL